MECALQCLLYYSFAIADQQSSELRSVLGHPMYCYKKTVLRGCHYPSSPGQSSISGHFMSLHNTRSKTVVRVFRVTTSLSSFNGGHHAPPPPHRDHPHHHNKYPTCSSLVHRFIHSLLSYTIHAHMMPPIQLALAQITYRC